MSRVGVGEYDRGSGVADVVLAGVVHHCNEVGVGVGWPAGSLVGRVIVNICVVVCVREPCGAEASAEDVVGLKVAAAFIEVFAGSE